MAGTKQMAREALSCMLQDVSDSYELSVQISKLGEGSKQEVPQDHLDKFTRLLYPMSELRKRGPA